MNAPRVFGLLAVIAGCASNAAPLASGPQGKEAPNMPARTTPREARPATTPTRSRAATPEASESDAARAFLLQLLDAARRGDSSAWAALQSQNLRARDQECAALASLRMQGWANDLGRYEEAIRRGRVFAETSGGRIVISVEAPGQEARAFAFVTLEAGGFRLDEN
jgi:hypothetical protein